MAKDTQEACVRCAVRVPTSADEERFLASYLDRNGAMDVVRFAPKDDDDMNAALCAGRFDRAVFPCLDALLTAVWKGDAQVDRWIAAGVRLELATPPLSHAEWQASVTAMYESLERWRKKQRRRQVIAAVILSIVALIAVGVLFYVVPPPQ